MSDPTSHRPDVDGLPDLIGATEAAKILGLASRSAVQYRVLAGHLTPLGRFGNAYVFDRADIEEAALAEPPRPGKRARGGAR